MSSFAFILSRPHFLGVAIVLLALAGEAFQPTPVLPFSRSFMSSSLCAATVRPSPSLRFPLQKLRMVAVATGGGGEGKEQGGEAEEKEWPAKELRSMDYVVPSLASRADLQPGEIAVRFINSPGRFPSDGKNDVIAAAKEGDVLMAVGDAVGIAIPRGCQTGLCGACTCDLEDPAFPGARSPLRACTTTVLLPDGCQEMVIDVYRMLNAKGGEKKDPMARFASLDDPNTGFKARWDLPEAGADAKQDCKLCGASGVNAQGMMPEDCTLDPGCPFSKF